MATAAAAIQENPLVNSTACLLLHFRRPGITRKLDKDEFKAGTADKTLVSASKTIIDSPEYKAIAAYEVSVKAWIKSKALPSKLYRDSTYLVPLAALESVDEYLERSKKEWQKLVDAFLAVYKKRAKETQARLRSIGKEEDYLSESQMKASFGFDHEYVTLSTPTTLRQVSAEMFKREQERLRDRLESAQGEIVLAMRAEFLGLVEHMAGMLTGKATDGKKQRFVGQRVEKMQEFIEQFVKEKNVCADDDLKAVMKDAAKLLQGVDPEDVRDDEKWKTATAKSFAEIASKLETMTRVRGRRKIESE